MKFTILYQDDDIAVINKPAGLLSVPDRYDPEVPSLSHLLSKRMDGVALPVHRLDRPTSGVVIFAKNTEAQRSLSMQFEERTVEKIYQAIVDGRPSDPTGLIDQPLAPHPSKLGKMIISNKGKKSQTKYVVTDFFGSYSLVELELLTGRTHQIRVHLAYLGHPLMVDPFYGNRKEFMLSSLKRRKYNLKKGETERPLLSRVPLHAGRLSINHPTTGERMTFEAEMPKDMRATVAQLRKFKG